MELEDEIKEISAAEAHRQLNQGQAQILDVREQDEWDYGHIEGSVFIPLWQLEKRWRELDRSAKWVCVCLSGVRSFYAASYLSALGLDASNLAGGMLSWQAHELPITDPGIVLGH